MPKRLVLVVEDDPDTRDLLVQLMNGEPDLRAVGVASVGKAMTVVSTVRPGLVLMDLLLPETGGADLARQLRAWPTTATLPLVAMSATAPDDGEARARAAGCDGFVAKPFDVDELLSVVRLFIQRR